MAYTYESPKRSEKKTNRDKEIPGRASSPGPDMLSLAAGLAKPSREQMGQRIDLASSVREKMEAAFGDLSAVKLYQSRAVEEAGAEAMSMGREIVFAPGLTDFSTHKGQHLLGHELSHVAKQARGEVRGRGFLDSPALEAQADREGDMAANGEYIPSSGGRITPMSNVGADAAAGPMQASKKDKRIARQSRLDKITQLLIRHKGDSSKVNLKSLDDGRLSNLSSERSSQTSSGGDSISDMNSELSENSGQPLKRVGSGSSAEEENLLDGSNSGKSILSDKINLPEDKGNGAEEENVLDSSGSGKSILSDKINLPEDKGNGAEDSISRKSSENNLIKPLDNSASGLSEKSDNIIRPEGPWAPGLENAQLPAGLDAADREMEKDPGKATMAEKIKRGAGYASLGSTLLGGAASAAGASAGFFNNNIAQTVSQEISRYNPITQIFSGVSDAADNFKNANTAAEQGDRTRQKTASMEGTASALDALSGGFQLEGNLGQFAKSPKAANPLSAVTDVASGAMTVSSGVYQIGAHQQIRNRMTDRAQRFKDKNGNVAEKDLQKYRTFMQARRTGAINRNRGIWKFGSGALKVGSGVMKAIDPTGIVGTGLGIGSSGLNVLGKLNRAFQKNTLRKRTVDEELHVAEKAEELRANMKAQGEKLSKREAETMVLMSMGIKSGTRREAFLRISMNRAIKLRNQAQTSNQEEREDAEKILDEMKVDKTKNGNYDLNAIGHRLGVDQEKGWQEQFKDIEDEVAYRRKKGKQYTKGKYRFFKLF